MHVLFSSTFCIIQCSTVAYHWRDHGEFLTNSCYRNDCRPGDADQGIKLLMHVHVHVHVHVYRLHS